MLPMNKDTKAQPDKKKVFVSYAHKNRDWLNTVSRMLSGLQATDIIEPFDDRLIAIGQEWDATIKAKLDEADLVILIVTFDFLGSAYINQVEIDRALQRHKEHRACLLPIIAEECDWQHLNWAKIQAWPIKDGNVLPLADWENTNAALTQISKDIRKWAETWRPVRAAAEDPPPTDPMIPPYRGLLAFEPEDKDDFFGRADLTDTLWSAISTNRLTLLTGASGSGKSSLVNAGTIPRLDPASWCIARTRPGETPIDNLARAIAAPMLPGADIFTITDKAKDLVRKLGEEPTLVLDYAATHKEQHKKSLFLVLDQFEETFNLAKTKNRKQHERLIDLLLAIARGPDQGPVKALLAMRSDFMTAFQDDRPELVEALQPATVLMRRMKPGEWAEAIEGPARRRNVTVEPSLLATLVDEVNRNPDALPLLQATLETLWAGRTGDTLKLKAYEALDGLAGALVERAEKALDDPAIAVAQARRLLLELVRIDPQGGIDNVTRQPRSRAHLDAIDPDFWQVGMRLTAPDLRLLVASRDPAADTETLDIAHEALFRRWPRLADWIEDERDFLLFTQRLDQRLADFTASGDHPDYHLPQSDLRTAQHWQEAHGKTFRPDQQSYIAKSIAFWAEDVADDEAKVLWGRLELSFSAWYGMPMPGHDRAALAALFDAEGDTRRRFLVLATTDADAARKLNRKPALVLRAALGLDPIEAAKLGAPALAVAAGARAFEADFAWLTLARHLMAIVPTHPPTIVNLARDLLAKTTDDDQLQDLVRAIAAVVMLDPTIAASRFERSLVAKPTDPDRLQECAALADYLDRIEARDAAASTVERALAAEITDPGRLEALSQALAARADTLGPTKARDAAASLVNRALELVVETNESYMLQVFAALAGKLDPIAAASLINRALDLEVENTKRYTSHVLAKAIAAVADKLDPIAAASLVNRALDLAAENTKRYTTHVLAKAIAAVADKLDPIRTASSVEHALDLAAEISAPHQLQVMAQAIAALAPRLATAPVLLAAIEVLKLPLGGDEEVTDTLLHAITTALGRPDLLRPFPEQSFWAVMQHLAEVKAANPDWEWLDLARPPLPPDELVATFRRLCADPPDARSA
jgi:ribosomal protein S7